MVEPSCQGPRRLVGIHIQSLSLAEFACAPQLSPTSMYLTVPKGKNVSIVCRVASDPVSTITWYFNGQKIHSSENENSNMVRFLEVSYKIVGKCQKTEPDRKKLKIEY